MRISCFAAAPRVGSTGTSCRAGYAGGGLGGLSCADADLPFLFFPPPHPPVGVMNSTPTSRQATMRSECLLIGYEDIVREWVRFANLVGETCPWTPLRYVPGVAQRSPGTGGFVLRIRVRMGHFGTSGDRLGHLA